MEQNKQKYFKALRQQIKDQQKWKDEAIELLTKNGVKDPLAHPSIVKFDFKIEALQQEADDFTLDSETFQTFSDKQETMKEKSKGPTHEVHRPHEDRWADKKVENAMKREWNWLCRMDGFVPQYMRDNLRKMPNNKGYIWKGIFYYGLLPPENPMDITTMFEKHNQALYIHEWTPKYYRIFEKSDRQKSKIMTFEKYF